MTRLRVGIAIAVVCLALVGWRVQRRYFPTCGQFGEHMEDLSMAEKLDTTPTAGMWRAACINTGASLARRRAVMGADTLKEASERIQAVNEEER